MSSSDRRAFLTLSAAAALAACGFTPAYGPSGGANALRGRVRATDPSTAFDYAFVARVEERLGRPEAEAFALTYGIKTETFAIGITQQNEVLRHDLSGVANWALKDSAGKTLASGTAQSFTAWFASGTTVATQAAEVDAGKRLMQALADQVVTQLIAKAGTLP